LEIVFENVDAKSEVVTDVQTLEAKFSPNDGGPSKTVTLRLGDPAHNTEMGCWGVLVEILGFDEPYAKTIYGEDWAQAIELAAKILPIVLEGCVDDAGGGTLNPDFFSRPEQSKDISDLPPEIAQALSNSSTSND
jgi:hypothetical protein